MILAFGALSFVVAPEASATRVACYGSNGERLLANVSASADEHLIASLPALIERMAKETDSTFQIFGALEKSSTIERSEYWMTDEHERFVITIAETSSTSVSLSIERGCQSKDAVGWKLAWEDALGRLEENGFKYE
ncbi:hypothetical protein Q9K02_06520 [Qipengyuania sp. G39]|uniref:Uncharacterized protein n=1 Tax=Qipengyuania profundimaris TaxID=3067652 RepID=A0ABT9HNR9_9SPHN|nr:hypothetical protein [Qipengyuania sp. G39]MDP4574793.1 hypothetical protein [Qipengyuania sp. G39]